MAFKIYKPQQIIEQLELCDTDGTVAATLDINIEADTIAQQFGINWNKFIELKTAVSTMADTADDYNKVQEMYGLAILSLFVLLFGKDNTDKLCEFYDNRYSTMIAEIMPFIEQIVVPAIIKANANKVNQIKQRYKK